MRYRTRLIAIAAAIAVGVGALTLIPGGTVPPSAEAKDDPVTPLVAAINEMTMSAPPKSVDVPAATSKSIPAVTQEASLRSTAEQEHPAVDPSLRHDAIGPSAVNLRDGPSASANKISVLQPGDIIGVGENSGTWVKVTLPDGTTGWISSRYLASAPQSVAPQRTANVETHGPARAVISGGGYGDLEGRTAVIGSRLIAYSGPSDSADGLFTLRPGTRVRIAQVSGNWVRIETANGISAWIRR